MTISLERSAPHTKAGEAGAENSEGVPKIPRSDGRVGGGGLPSVGSPLVKEACIRM